MKEQLKYKVAAVQYEPSQFNKKLNIDSLLMLSEQAAKEGAKLIVTPEMGTTGYCWLDRKEVEPMLKQYLGIQQINFLK